MVLDASGAVKRDAFPALAKSTNAGSVVALTS
jgi:hypothetical protein